MTINNEYDIGQPVYLKTDPEQHERLITGIMLRQGSVCYMVTCGENETPHYDYEMTTERNVSMALGFISKHER